jgi:glutathione S-transferase
MAEATLYGFDISHPTVCARLALERKGVETKNVDLMPGFHPVLVRALRFPRNTVPALKIDGLRMQGTRIISSYLERTRPEPPIFGTTPEERRRIEEAEAWGERVFQPMPRKAFRLAGARHQEMLEYIARSARLPAPTLAARTSKPIALIMARSEGATEETVRKVLRDMPGALDHVDSLIADGTIGGPEPNAADFQIFTTIQSMLTMPDLEPFLAGRPCMEVAGKVAPPMPGPVPKLIPQEWIAEALSADNVA